VAEIAHLPILVAIETDATHFHGENASRPRLLDKGQAEQMLAHLSADLAALLPEIADCSLTMPGALYDQTQLLRPGYPVIRTLEALRQQHGASESPIMLGIGHREGRMPAPELVPEPDVTLGLLLALPVLASGAPGLAGALSRGLGQRFRERGRLPADATRGLEAKFGIRVIRARFMTLADLHAMLKMQLEHFGFLPLWELLNAALENRDEPLEVTGRNGQGFAWRDGAVRSEFETFDEWATRGGGRALPDADLALAGGYAEWTREYRQYLTTLLAHGVSVRQYLPGCAEPLDGSYLVEESPIPPRSGTAQVTEHSSGDLGTVAVTVVREGRLFNYYPLIPAGLNELHTSIRAAGLGGGGVAFPGGINYDTRTRRLIPEALHPGHDRLG
jgi:hypothetical protein